MFCSTCGAQAEPLAQHCGGCGTAMSTVAAAGVAAAPAYAPLMSQPQTIVIRSGKSAGLAAVLSFFWCGLGQIYNGEIGKGIAFIALYVVSIVLMFVLIGFLTTPILWIWGMVDAYRTAERLNQQAGLA